MRIFWLGLLTLLCLQADAQIVFPKGFRLIAGENYSGEDDVYSNGACAFSTHILFREYDFKKPDAGVQHYLAEYFGFPFYLTKDGFCWGTGRSEGVYSYAICDPGGQVVELRSATNDSTFSYYSKWLLNTARSYHREGKSFMFPMRKLPAR